METGRTCNHHRAIFGLDKTEWFDVVRRLRPDWTEDDFEAAWLEFVETKRRKELKITLDHRNYHRYKQAIKGGNKAMAFDPSKFGKWAHKAIKIDTDTLNRSRKVFALYVRGATDGEKQAAHERLVTIAAKNNVEIGMFLKVLQNA